LAVVAALMTVGTACNSRLLRPPATIFVDGGETNLTPAADTDQRSFPAVLLSFFPSQIQLYAGDSLRFDMRYNGEPHTVALGTLVDDAVKAANRLGPQAGVRKVEGLPEMRRVPQLLPGTVESRSPKVNRSAAEPCFLDSGEPPNSATGGALPCPERDKPEFDGTQSFYSSGFLPEGEGFRIKLSSDTRPGAYRFMCLVHRAAMQGEIEVRRPGTGRPAVAKVKIAARDEQRVVTAAVTTYATDAAKRNGLPVLAGVGSTGQIRGFVAGFVPDLVKARVGEPVSWRLFETHSISFNPARQARDGLVVQERGGEVRLNLDAWRSVGSIPPPYPVVSYPPPANKKASIDGGTYDGEGPFSSGVIRATPPLAVTYTLRFAKRGTYPYFCLVHDGMRGRVVVS
jgi:plastocyanin